MAGSRPKYTYNDQPVYHNTSGMIRGPQLRPPIKFAPPQASVHRSESSLRPGAPAVPDKQLKPGGDDGQANMDGKSGGTLVFSSFAVRHIYLAI